jgi:hypothetical protein
MCGDRQIWAVALTVLLICGCATPAYKDVFKDKPAYNSKSFTVSRDILYQATLRAICARNFIIEKEDQEKGFILAKRSFQRGRKTIILVLQANASFDETQRATLYLNAMETTERYFVADRTRFFLWLIPLPGGGGKEGTSIKEGEKIIEDKTFYKNFFVEIEEEAKRLSQAKVSRKHEKEISAAVQAPEAEKNATEEVSPQAGPAEEIIPKEVAVPEIAPAEVVTNETVTQETSFPESVFPEIPVQEKTLPAEKNLTNSSE